MNPATKMFRDGHPSRNNPHESNATKIEFCGSEPSRIVFVGVNHRHENGVSPGLETRHENNSWQSKTHMNIYFHESV